MRLLAAWDDERAHRVGVLVRRGLRFEVETSIAVPTRAHGVARLPGGDVLAVARRPGDWLLRWRPASGQVRMCWADPGRAFNGHVVCGPGSDGSDTLYASETDLDSGAGYVAVLDARRLDRLATWPAHGIDPHALLIDGATLLVANGGVPTRTETGRVKLDLERMDSSLVRLARLGPAGGALRGQWRLADPRLSLRHLARRESHIGIALQAEHDDADSRAAAPVLAVFDGSTLAALPAPPLAGYGGDIAASAAGFVVSCPRADALLWWQPGAAPRTTRLRDACALTVIDGRVWAAGQGRVSVDGSDVGFAAPPRIDNHWVATIVAP